MLYNVFLYLSVTVLMFSAASVWLALHDVADSRALSRIKAGTYISKNIHNTIGTGQEGDV